MVGLVIVAHSKELADGVRDLALQMAMGAPVPVLSAGGTEDDRLGTSFEKVEGALREALETADEVLILVDLGSAVMVTQMAVESLSPDVQERVQMTNAPVTEGAIAAVVAAAGGDSIDTVRQAAEQALATPKIPDEPPLAIGPGAAAEEAEAAPEEEEMSVELVIPNPTGLHARPAARFVRLAMTFDADIRVQNVTHDRPAANAKSMMEVANRGTAMQGERIRITARGEDAAEALEALRELGEGGFGEIEESAPAAERPAERAPVAAAEPTEAVAEEGRLQGIPASEGVAVGPAFIARRTTLKVEQRAIDDVEAEKERLEGALTQARSELLELQEEVGRRDVEVAEIFEFQRMMLEDPGLVDALKGEIEAEGFNAEAAVDQVMGTWVDQFATGESEITRLRAVDVQDAGERVLRILMGLDAGERVLQTLPEPVIVIAEELTPSDTAQLDRERVLGVCTAAGGATSHVAILARMWNLPAVVGVGEALLEVPSGATLAIDGETGMIEIDPSDDVVAEYEERGARRATRLAEALEQAEEAAITQDGHQVEVVANIGDVESAQEALRFGAEGVGLLRTEFLYLDRNSVPDEEEQYAAYRAIADVMGDRPLIIRTLDVGGDKPLPYLDLPSEMNPFLGVRAIRLSLRHPELFQPQLRAILRAGAGRNVKVMFPLVATEEEVVAARKALDTAAASLEADEIDHAESIEMGIMVETPASAVLADALAPLVDFFSIGSNDLTQYTLACDRGNEQLGALYQALDPAVLRLIRSVIDAAHAEGKWVGLCGELAGQAQAIPVLLGLGLDEFSMTPRAIPEAKQIIRRMTLEEAQEIAERALSLPNAAAVKEYLESQPSD